MSYRIVFALAILAVSAGFARGSAVALAAPRGGWTDPPHSAHVVAVSVAHRHDPQQKEGSKEAQERQKRPDGGEPAATKAALPPVLSDDARRGAFAIRVAESHPLGRIAEQCKRCGWKASRIAKEDPSGGKYDLEKSTFQVYVPASHDRKKPSGLLVWLSPGGIGTIPAEWHATLARHNVIAVGPDGAGNDEFVWRRQGLALDAVHDLCKHYAIDAARIWVTGHSGGGRLASRLGVLYPDVFRGGIYQGGCNHFRKVPVPGDATRAWGPHFVAPSGSLLRLARERSHHVLVNGSGCMNLVQAREISRLWTGTEHFRHVTLLVMPERGHVPVDAKFLDDALRCLESAPK